MAETLALPAIAKTFAADAVCLYAIDDRLNAGDHCLFNLDPESLALYRQEFVHLDPMHPRHTVQKGSDVVLLSEVMAASMLAGHPYYRHFMRPFGIGDECEILLRDGTRPVAGLSIIRRTGRQHFAAADVSLARNTIPLLHALLRGARATDRHPAEALLREGYELTARECEIVALVRAGVPNKVIASRLGIKLATVKSHIHHILEKTGTRSRAELISAFFVS